MQLQNIVKGNFSNFHQRKVLNMQLLRCRAEIRSTALLFRQKVGSELFRSYFYLQKRDWNSLW